MTFQVFEILAFHENDMKEDCIIRCDNTYNSDRLLFFFLNYLG